MNLLEEIAPPVGIRLVGTREALQRAAVLFCYAGIEIRLPLVNPAPLNLAFTQVVAGGRGFLRILTTEIPGVVGRPLAAVDGHLRIRAERTGHLDAVVADAHGLDAIGRHA